MTPFHRVVAGAFVVAAVGMAVGVRWHALVGDEVGADVVGVEHARRENTDGTTREVLMPTVRLERDGVSRDAVVTNEFFFADVRVGDRLTVWVHDNEVVARDTVNDLLRGALLGFSCATATYLALALLTLQPKRK